MANKNCSSCEDIRQYAPDFATNGVTDTVCTSLQNNTGLNPSSGHIDFDDLNDVNDCLIDGMDKQVDSYEVCDWKPFMHKFIPNVYTTFKAIICSIGGLWKKIDCTYKGLVNLVNTLNSTTGGQAFVRYYRDNSGTGAGYTWNASEGAEHNLEVYMDCDVDNPGNKPADRDYLVIISYCCDMHRYSILQTVQVWYSSADTRSIDLIRKRQAQHPADSPQKIDKLQKSWTVSTAVLVKKGAHLKFNSCDMEVSGSGTWYRVHQVTLTWIPVNIDSSLDPSKIIPC